MNFLAENPTFFIIRGLPGCGKTTLAEFLADEINWAVAIGPDDYEGYYPDGNVGDPESYRYTPECHDEAHEWMQSEVDELMRRGCHYIFVHEVCTTGERIDPLLELAEKHGFEVVSMVVENRHGSESVHSVPDDIMLEKDEQVRSSLSLLPERIERRKRGGRKPKYPLGEMRVGETFLVDPRDYKASPSHRERLGQFGAQVQQAQNSLYAMARRANRKVSTRRVKTEDGVMLEVTMEGAR